ncbi:hypothetical protein ABC977_16475 [Thioalkalicoccus limnaeus]|uniref:Uncharacterized protein n=1 Tax=Thioalkalicoccus limnaeus TaxID=120681 RepID=A0ABV4BHK0_9GAMM
MLWDTNESRRRFVLLDPDGTIITERRYLADPAGAEQLPGAGAGLRRMKVLGLGLVVITSQSGVARGFVDVPQLDRIHARLSDLLRQEGAIWMGSIVAPIGRKRGATAASLMWCYRTRQPQSRGSNRKMGSA